MVLTAAGRRHQGNPVRHHGKYFCRVCRQCRRNNIDGVTKHQCVCRKRPSAKLRAPIQDDGAIATIDGLKVENTLQRPLGLEIEVSYMGTAGALSVPPYVRYQWVHDGSITAGGQELVLEPLVGANFLNGLISVAADLKRYEFKADKSCGLHVHVGVPEWGPYELRRLILLYRQFENVFYSLVEPGRDGWREHRGERKYYCKRFEWNATWYERLASLTEGSEIRKYLFQSLYADRLHKYCDRQGRYNRRKPRSVHNGGAAYTLWPVQHAVDKDFGSQNMQQVREHKYEACRYLGLNLHTWMQRGTVEYRHHEGTVSLSKLLMWPLWCGWFTEVASVMTDREAAQCTTLDALLDTEYKRAYSVTAIPHTVRQWVRKTLDERKTKEKK